MRALGALATLFVLTGSPAEPASDRGLPSVALRFSDRDQIDRSQFDTRDRTKPFYFQMAGPPDLGPQQFTVDIGSTFDVWLDPRVPPDSGPSVHARSLALSLWSDQDRNVKDKIFLDAVRHQSPDPLNVHAPDNERFVSFDLMLDKTYQAPRYWVIHFQVLQCCAGHPPLTIKVLPDRSNDKTIGMEVTIANDDSERADYGKAVQLATFDVARERWTHIVLDLKPSPCGEPRPGKVVAWVEKRKIVDWQGCWGYEPNPASSSERGLVNADMSIDVGIYRRRQPTKQTIYLSNIDVSRTIVGIAF